MFRTDDPFKDLDRWEAQQQEKLDRLPKCTYCDEPIQDDFYFEINGECICEQCLNDNHRKRVEDYVE